VSNVHVHSMLCLECILFVISFNFHL
jgi:hypothetical protein